MLKLKVMGISLFILFILIELTALTISHYIKNNKIYNGVEFTLAFDHYEDRDNMLIAYTLYDEKKRIIKVSNEGILYNYIFTNSLCIGDEITMDIKGLLAKNPEILKIVSHKLNNIKFTSYEVVVTRIGSDKLPALGVYSNFVDEIADDELTDSSYMMYDTGDGDKDHIIYSRG